jgi:hypothetical protein
MPKLAENTALLQTVVAQVEDMNDLTAWHRSARGNFTRYWGEHRLTCFRRAGKWHWCIANGPEDTARFSRVGYTDVTAAVWGVAEELLGDAWLER